MKNRYIKITVISSLILLNIANVFAAINMNNRINGNEFEKKSSINSSLFTTATSSTLLSESSSESFSSISIENDGTFRMLFTGDSMLGRSIGPRIVKGENPYQHVKDFLVDFDLVYTNFETSMGLDGEGSKQNGKAWTFKAPLEAMGVLKESNIKILGLANNHIKDYGGSLITKMMERFDDAGFVHFGVGNTVNEAFKVKYIEEEGVKIALFGVNSIEGVYNNVKDGSPGAAYFKDDKIKASLKEARENADVVIVFPHWGTERTYKNNSFQEKYGKMFVDNGADLVIGMHAHVVQNVEIYKGKYIYYSLGNYVFEEDKVTNKGLNVEIKVSDKKIVEIKEYDVSIQGSFPRTVTERKTISL